MNYLMTLIALVFAVIAGAQNFIYEYPWNPDSNNDNFVGTGDLTAFLSAFGSEFGNPPEPCDYDGTPLEDFIVGVADGSIILDSLFVEYELEDASTYYVLGCPDPVTDTLVFANSGMINLFTLYSIDSGWEIKGADTFGQDLLFQSTWNLADGLYRFKIGSNALSSLGFVGDGFFTSSSNGSSSHNTIYTSYNSIPFPEEWYLDEEGIHFESEWDPVDWAYYANYLHILPYWHYAD